MPRVLLALPVLALLLAACGDDGESTVQAVDLIRATSDAAADVGTASMEMTVEGGPVAVEASGQFDFENQQGTMTMEMPAPLSTTFDMVMDGTTTFMSADAFGPLLPGGDAEWIRFDAEELAEQSGIDVDQLTGGAGGSNPADILAGLEGISEDGIDEVGSEEVRGVDTTHYAGEIDMEAALQQLEDAGAEGVMDDEAMDRFQELYGDTAIPVDVWIDDDGLARRMSMVAPAAGEEVEITIEMFDYGEPVDIEVPDESDSVDFQELLGQLGGN